MQMLSCDVRTYCIGQAASMGAVLLAAGSHGKRFALPNARIMVHQPSGGFGGTAADAEIQVNELLHYKTLLYDILAKHIGKPADQIKKDSDRDFFMSATAAQEYGVVDQVLPPNESKR
jgi:ATP-dependent Clp protease protease subunit